jgi:hypothetical protein
MSLLWTEIRDNALRFSREWKDETSEDAEAKTFWDDFFQVFGIRRRVVASFEEKVRNARGKYSFIDLFWSGHLLVEHKSRGKDLGHAKSQAFQYIQDLINDARLDEIPRYVLLSDFSKFALFDLEPEEPAGLPQFNSYRVACVEFPLQDLHKHVREFAFIRGEKAIKVNPEDAANIDAAEIMGELHDALRDGGFRGHDLEQFLVRVLFCLFAEDTGIFEPNAFTNFVQKDSAEDGSDLGVKLAALFEVLNTPEGQRQKKLDEDLAAFPYVNGDLFAERLGFADFDRSMREALLECTAFKWEKISPAIFGSMFQGVLEDKERRQIGAHYTSERDILKLIRSLFLDDLWERFAECKTKATLRNFHDALAALTFFDPACGCGNFLVITYRELRLLELEILKKLYNPKASDQAYLDVKGLIRLSVESIYGIEIEEWPARIAEVALWLVDHQMNQLVAETYGNAVPSVPLRKSPHISCRNALLTDWESIVSKDQCSYILGNPPFVGKKEQNAEQKADVAVIWKDVKGTGILDYVCCWYQKAAAYIKDTEIKCAFVSTNSITQGEQVGVLWDYLFGRWQIKIHFGHRTFKWESEARGQAHVSVVIIGFASYDITRKKIYEYAAGTPIETTVENINPYLLAGNDTTVRTRRGTLNGAPEISYGSMMIDKKRDAGDEEGLILTRECRDALLAECPGLAPYIRKLMGGDEFLNGTERWCLWLVGAPSSLLRSSPLLRERIEKIRDFRLGSDREQTNELAKTPTEFGEIRQPTTNYLLFPKVSSENRKYIPIGFVTPDIIASGSALIVPQATVFDFGLLSSEMHNAWMRCVAGRLESRFQYSNNIVYNNFPWPENVSDRHRERVIEAAENVLSIRAGLVGQTLAEMYDSVFMPPELANAHSALDGSVDKCYRSAKFGNERERLEFLFKMYEQIFSRLTLEKTSPRRRR